MVNGKTDRNREGSSRREFLRLGAAAAMGVGFLNCGGPGASPVRPEPQDVGGVMVDDLPLLGPYLLPTETPFETLRIAFRGMDEKTKSDSGAVHFGIKDVGERELRFAAGAKHVLELKNLTPDREYHYQLDLGEYKSPKYRFRTSPQPGTRAKTIKVGLLFDMHFQEPERLRLPKPTPGMFFRHCASMFTSLRKFGPDMLLLGGDMIDGVIEKNDNADRQYEMLSSASAHLSAALRRRRESDDDRKGRLRPRHAGNHLSAMPLPLARLPQSGGPPAGRLQWQTVLRYRYPRLRRLRRDDDHREGHCGRDVSVR